MKGFSVIMYDHKWKKPGMAISVAGLALMLAERVKGFVLFGHLDVHRQNLIFEWVMLFGLFVVITCKEKFEDERTRAVRQKTFQMSFTVVLSILMAFMLTNLTSGKSADIPIEALMMLCGTGVLFYLFMFNIGLHFDSLWDYGDQSVMDNLRSLPRNKLNILIYLVFCAVVITFLYFVNTTR